MSALDVVEIDFVVDCVCAYRLPCRLRLSTASTLSSTEVRGDFVVERGATVDRRLRLGATEVRGDFVVDRRLRFGEMWSSRTAIVVVVSVSSRTEPDDDVVDVTPLSSLDVVEINKGGLGRPLF